MLANRVVKRQDVFVSDPTQQLLVTSRGFAALVASNPCQPSRMSDQQESTSVTRGHYDETVCADAPRQYSGIARAIRPTFKGDTASMAVSRSDTMFHHADAIQTEWFNLHQGLRMSPLVRQHKRCCLVLTKVRAL